MYKLTNDCIRYDPNFQDDGGAGEDMEMDEDDGWGADDGYDDQDDMNDDDTAWKVRKSSVKIIEALVGSCPGFLKAKWGNFVDLLTERFGERSNTVKIDIMNTF